MEGLLRFLQNLLPHPQSMPWREDHFGLLHRLFWNEIPFESPEPWFRTLGVVHLYASSGIHVYAFLETVDQLLRPWVIRSRTSVSFWKRAVFWLALALVFWAWSLQDFRVGFARPLVTFLFRKWAHQRGFKFRLLAPLLGTALLDGILDFGAGRIHYYLAVAGGLLALEHLKEANSTLQKSHSWSVRWQVIALHHGAIAVGSWIWTSAVDLGTAHRISWATPIWSLLTIPVLTLGLYPMSLLSLFFTGEVVEPLLKLWSAWSQILLIFADLLPGPISVSTQTLALSLGLAVLGMKTNLRTPVAWTVGMGFFLIQALEIQHQKLIQLNVGQGDALWIKKNLRIEMVDAGPAWGRKPIFWIDKAIAHQIQAIDTLVLSHLDADHVGGVESLLMVLPVKCLVVHQQHVQHPRFRDYHQLWMSLDPELRIQIWSDKTRPDCFRTGMLDAVRTTQPRHNGNDWMVGAQVPMGLDSLYLSMGDGDRSQEDQWLRKTHAYWNRFETRIWKLGHHGSKDSTDLEALQKLQPSRVWVSVGKTNRYGHPHRLSLERLKRLRLLDQLESTALGQDLVADFWVAKTSHPSR